MATNLITLTIEDAGGNKSPVSVYVQQDDADTIASLRTDYVTVLWNAIRPLISGVLVAASIRVGVDISELTNNTPTALSDVEEKALFTFVTAEPRHPVTMSLPTAKETIFTNSGAGYAIDETNADVLVFQAVMTDALEDNGINATDSHGQDLSLWAGGKQYFKG